MNCALFNERLGGLLAGTLSPEEKAQAEAHAAGCLRCGEVRARWGEAAGRRSADVPGDLAAGILSRTSGSPCERARARLGDLADGGGLARQPSTGGSAWCPTNPVAVRAVPRRRLLGDLADGGAGIGTVERRGFPVGYCENSPVSSLRGRPAAAAMTVWFGCGFPAQSAVRSFPGVSGGRESVPSRGAGS